MAEERVQRRLAAIVSADVVGYSRMMGEDEAGTLARLKALRSEFLHPKVAEHGGRIVKTTGDGTLIEFASAVDAVSHAVDVQRGMAERNAGVAEHEQIRLRIGINVGDVIIDGDDIHGDGVNVAARLEALAEPGGICVSAAVHDHVHGRLDVAFEDLGDQQVKNIASPVRVFQFQLEARGAGPLTDRTDPSRAPRRPAIAVLPFTNLSGDPEQEVFADGLTEDLITALSHWRSFSVIARNSTFAYKGTSPDIREVAAHLGVRYVLEGSVRRAGERIRITAQLIDGETGNHVWAERYDRNLTDFFDLQDEITQAIAARVEPEFSSAEQRRAHRRPVSDFAAWEWYQRGASALNELTPDSIEHARECFIRAIEIDPTDSGPYSALAFCHFRRIVDSYSESRQEELENVIRYARRAVALDDSDAFAHFVLGCGYAYLGQHARAIAEGRRAVELNPNHAAARMGLGIRLSYDGNPQEGIRHLELAVRLNPDGPHIELRLFNLAEAHLNNRDYEKAIEWARKSIARREDFPLPHLVLASALGHLGRSGEAQAALATALELRPNVFSNRKYSILYRRPEDSGHILDGLRKAGLRE